MAEDFVKDESNWVYVALDNGQIVGFAFGYVLNFFYASPRYYIHYIDVIKEYRQRGIGKSLMAKMFEDCHTQGINSSFLVTNKSNIPAVKLYESVDGDAKYADDVVYQWNLSRK